MRRLKVDIGVRNGYVDVSVDGIKVIEVPQHHRSAVRVAAAGLAAYVELEIEDAVKEKDDDE